MINKEEITFLNQLIKALEEAELKLEEDYRKRNYQSFNTSKKFILQVQEKIAEVIK